MPYSMTAFSECLEQRLLWTADADLAAAVRRALYEAISHQHAKGAEHVNAITQTRETLNGKFLAAVREVWTALASTEQAGSITSISEQAAADAELVAQHKRTLELLSERLVALCAKRDNKIAKLLEAYGADSNPIAVDSGNFRFARTTTAVMQPAEGQPEASTGAQFGGRSYDLGGAEESLVLYASPTEVVFGTRTQLRLYDRESTRLLHVIEPAAGCSYRVTGACGNSSSSDSPERLLERVRGVRYARGLVSSEDDHRVIAQPFFLVGISQTHVRVWNHSTQKLLLLPAGAGRLILEEHKGLLHYGAQTTSAAGLY